jgi:putative phosphoesterase
LRLDGNQAKSGIVKLRNERLQLKSGRVGLISDTHGVLRPEALSALKGSELIIHAGDIGKEEVLDSLAAIATVIAIRGNNDRQPWARKLPDVLNLRINGVKLYAIHDVKDLRNGELAEDCQLVVSGHSHKPCVISRGGVLYINPGSAGPRRFKLPVAVARLKIGADKNSVKIVELRV